MPLSGASKVVIRINDMNKLFTLVSIGVIAASAAYAEYDGQLPFSDFSDTSEPVEVPTWEPEGQPSYGEPGYTQATVGDTTYGSDGSICTRVGSTVYC